MVFIDNPTIAVHESGVAILGGDGFRYRLARKNEFVEADTSSVQRVFGIWQPTQGASVPIETTEIQSGASGNPIVAISGPRALDVVWRSAVVSDRDTSWQLVQGRWVNGTWYDVRSMLDGFNRNLLTQPFTSRAVASADGSWAYLLVESVRRTSSALQLRHVGRSWIVDTIATLEAMHPTVVVLDSQMAIVAGLAGREPYGNTIVSFRRDKAQPQVTDEARVSLPNLPIVQWSFAFPLPGSVGIIYAGGRSGREDAFFPAVSEDSGRTWQAGPSIEFGESILAWDAVHDGAGRALILAHLVDRSLPSGSELRLLLYDSVLRSWQVLWRAGSEVAAFGVPAVGFANGRLHLAFSAAAQYAPRLPVTHLLSFALECRAEDPPSIASPSGGRD
jgi:hypothetical protein